MPTADYKRCSDCNELKPLAEFNRNRHSADGRHSQCKPCARIRRQTQQHRAHKVVYNREWRRKNPEKYAAHVAVRKALGQGNLVKASACADCQAQDKELVAHHSDYTKPLDVLWLCRQCHGREHF